jgi:hypothetical protein
MKNIFNKSVIKLFIIIILVSVSLPSHAITWCHDYTVYAITKKDANRTKPVQLRSILKDQLGYKCFKFTNAAHNPKAQSKLRPGDVIIIGDAHSGVVNQKGLINHFIQKFGSSGTAYQPLNIFSMDNFYQDWTLLQMMNFKRKTPDGRIIQPYKNQKVEVWRKYK